MKDIRVTKKLPDWITQLIVFFVIVGCIFGIFSAAFIALDRYRAEELPPGYKIISNGIEYRFICNHSNCFNKIPDTFNDGYVDAKNAVRGAAMHAGTDRNSRAKKEQEELIKNHGIRIIEIESGRKY